MLLEVEDLQKHKTSSSVSSWLLFLTRAENMNWQLSETAWVWLLGELSEQEWRFAFRSEKLANWILNSVPSGIVEGNFNSFTAEQKEVLASSKVNSSLQRLLLEEGKEVLLALALNPHLDRDANTVLALKLRHHWDSLPQREQDLLRSSNAFTWNLDLDAQFCFLVNAAFCLQQMNAFDADAETVNTLRRDWEGSLRELLEACEELKDK